MVGPTLFWISYAALWFLLIVATLLMIEIIRRLANIPTESPLPGSETFLDTGSPAPPINAPDLRSERTLSSQDWLGQAVSLVFVSPHCSACNELAEDLSDPNKRFGGVMAMICVGSEGDCREFAGRHSDPLPLLLDEDGDIGGRYRVRATPTVVQLDEAGRILRYGSQRTLQQSTITL